MKNCKSKISSCVHFLNRSIYKMSITKIPFRDILWNSTETYMLLWGSPSICDPNKSTYGEIRGLNKTSYELVGADVINIFQ